MGNSAFPRILVQSRRIRALSDKNEIVYFYIWEIKIIAHHQQGYNNNFDIIEFHRNDYWAYAFEWVELEYQYKDMLIYKYGAIEHRQNT